MKHLNIIISVIFIFVFTLIMFASSLVYEPVQTTDNQYYEYRALHNRDGIGKYYLGREIAKVMRHQEFLWLERPSREAEEQPSKVIEALNLQPTDTIADIGAGSGYFSFRIAKKVPQGLVYAVDVQPEMIDIIDFLVKESPDLPVLPVLGSETSPNLPPESINFALMVDTYHEFNHPREMMENIVKALKPQGKVVLVEYRKENPLIMIKGVHKMSEKQVKKEMEAVGLKWLKTDEFLPQQHYLVFEK
ncbi:methyltransferase domain-containing protein [Cyanobacterium aponinum FACHB-4101]|uniref:class I SAM-dependent methyltransferase n=1 Tax=Cyanobacterium aponinum TaxID=379064 RepID=UPI0016815F11|nr:class I SAM-dependent methyltransferase [Cyanobacterium aponinum]MBD2393544.1 methyltransferase domain-containing protein [Cyanobacterium aponinum FACHB-4101]